VATDQFKNRKSVLVANNRLAIYQTGPNRVLADRRRNNREPMREVVSRASKQPHTGTVPLRENAKAVIRCRTY
jgi:hypothetical protein